MSARINTILIIGATRGIGEAMARRFHAMGKKVLAAGISGDKLAELAGELEGLETYTVGCFHFRLSVCLSVCFLF